MIFSALVSLTKLERSFSFPRPIWYFGSRFLTCSIEPTVVYPAALARFLSSSRFEGSVESRR